MYVCPNCNYHSESPVNFCPNCGAQMVYVENQQQTYQQPYQQYQTYQQNPQYYAPQRPNNLGKKIPSIILGAFGLVFGFFNILYTIVFLSLEPEVAFVFSIIMSFFSFPLSIVGKTLSRKCMDDGDDSKSASVGSGLGTAGIVLTIISLALGFIALAGA